MILCICFYSYYQSINKLNYAINELITSKTHLKLKMDNVILIINAIKM